MRHHARLLFHLLAALAIAAWLGCPPDDDDVVDDDDTGDDDDSADDDDATGDDDDNADDDSADDDDTTPTGDVYLAPGVAFEDTVLGCDAVLEVQVINQGEDRVEIGGAAVDPGGEQFVVVPPADWPITIFPGFDLELEVVFAPLTPEDHTGTLVVQTDHPDLPEITLALTGTGLSDGDVTDTFVQEEDGDMVDVLWVVDNSCSMAEEQGSLGQNADTFVGLLEAEGLDYQIGVVTTDSGVLQGADPIISSALPDPAASFAAAVQLGTNGSWTEMPLHHGYTAVTSPLVDPGAPNDGFVREAAGLAVIVVTDEADQSGGDVPTWVAQFQALKPNPDAVAVSGIYGQATGCSGADGVADPDPVLEAIIAETGGVEVSICDTDWSPVLSVAPTLVSAPAARFELTEPAMPLTVDVSVEGAALTEGWSFDADGNAVVFDHDAMPEPGETIEVHYHVVGDCGPEAQAGGVR